MRKTICAALAVLAMTGTAAAADKFYRSVDEVNLIMDVGTGGAAWVVDKCTAEPGSNGYAIVAHNRAFADWINNTGNPGSAIVCGGKNSSGMLYVSGEETYIAGGRFVRFENKTKSSGVTHEFAADSYISRLYDSNGNYLLIKYDKENPANSRFIDAKLPISLQSNGAILAEGKGISISANELIDGLNKYYHTYNGISSTGEIATMKTFSVWLLTNPDQRQAFVDAISKR